MARFTTWWGQLPRRNQMLTITLVGIVIGVLLLATGIALIQFTGTLLVALALLVARAGARFPNAGWANPRGQHPTMLHSIQSRFPAWLWPLCVAVLLVILGILLIVRILMSEDLSWATLGDLGKGVIALAMIATLALWSRDFPAVRRFTRRNKDV